jgi:hypothetical protein
MISGGIPTRYHNNFFLLAKKGKWMLYFMVMPFEWGIPEIINWPLGSVSGSHLFWEHPFVWWYTTLTMLGEELYEDL